MTIGFVYMVFDTEIQQYRKERYPTIEPAQIDAALLNRPSKTSRFIVYPVSVYPTA